MKKAPGTGQPVERIQAELEQDPNGTRVRIFVEEYHEPRGWCLIGSISLPLSELPLLEQALQDMRAGTSSEEPEDCKIIPFPGPGRFAEAATRPVPGKEGHAQALTAVKSTTEHGPGHSQAGSSEGRFVTRSGGHGSSLLLPLIPLGLVP